MTIAEAPTGSTAAEGIDPAKGKAVVLYDGLCAFCRRSVALLARLDWLGRLYYQNCRDTDHWPASAVPLELKALLAEMHVVTPDRARAPAGYRAVRWMAWRLPPLMPLAPLMHLPGALWLGNKLYRWVAKHRFDLVPCDDGGCRIPNRGRKTDDGVTGKPKAEDHGHQKS
jgi:predicted DCC family thiol-disulfide oxidoreductase YuxK